MEYIKVTSENIKKSIYAARFLITMIFRSLQKRPGCQSGLERAWFF